METQVVAGVILTGSPELEPVAMDRTLEMKSRPSLLMRPASQVMILARIQW